MGMTGTYGFPYQELGDPPDGPALGQNLAEAVETELERIDAKDTAQDTKDTEQDGRLVDLEAVAITHIAAGDQLDAAVAAPSQPAGLTLITGKVSVNFTAAVGQLNFPAPGFANGVLAFHATTMSGSSATAVINSGNITKTGVQVYLQGAGGACTLAYVAIGW